MIEPTRRNWDSLIESLIPLTEVVVLESQDMVGKSYLAAFPTKQYLVDSQAESTQVLEEVFSTNTWRFGFISYDVKNDFEELNSTNPALFNCPEVWLMEPGFLLEWNHSTNEWITLVGKLPVIETQIDSSDNFRVGELYSNFSEEEYIATIESIQDDIKDGTYYELNLSRMISANFEGSPFALFKAMRKIGPVPMASFISTKKWSICSSSPEIFLEKKGSLIRSNPIKGTRPRNKVAQDDKLLIESLLNSDKEKAENLMIVDLVRNDFNRIAKSGSVKVSKLFQIETYETVHQMVSEVIAELRTDIAWMDILKATYPMGSMTGAPKIEAMKSIDKYERNKRSIYSGSIGCFSPNNDAILSVVIRTAFIQNDKLFYGVGGAITSDSDPKQEWEETIIKTQALLQALN